MQNYLHLYPNIVAVRKATCTQKELAEKIGISLKYISRIENGNNGVKTQTLIKYMNVL